MSERSKVADEGLMRSVCPRGPCEGIYKFFATVVLFLPSPLHPRALFSKVLRDMSMACCCAESRKDN